MFCGSHRLGQRIPPLSNPIPFDAAAQRSVISCSAVPHQQSRRVLNLPAPAATLIVVDVLTQLVWRVGLRRHVEQGGGVGRGGD